MSNSINTHTHTHAHTNTNARREGGRDGDGNGDGSGKGDWIGNGNGNENGEGREGGGELWYPPHQERSRVEDQALPSRTRHYLRRQEVAPPGSQQLRA